MKTKTTLIAIITLLLMLATAACSSGASGGGNTTPDVADTIAEGDDQPGTDSGETSGGEADSSKPDVDLGGETANLVEADSPASVTAVSENPEEITVSWIGNSNDSRYTVVVDTNSDFPETSAYKSIDPATSPITIAGIAGNDYYVWVVPVLLDGSLGSETAANGGVTLTVQTSAPEIPSAISAVTETNGTLTVSWTGNSNAGSYSIIVDDDSSYNDDTPLVKNDGVVSGTVVSGLDSGSYYAWIVVYDNNGDEVDVLPLNSASSIAIINSATDPAEDPTSVTASTPSLGTATISWDGEVNGGSYIIVIDNDYDFTNDTPVQTITSASSPYTVTGLSSATYYFWVIPVDKDGNSGTETAANSGSGLDIYNGTLDSADDTWNIYSGKSTTIPVANLLANDANNMTDDPLEIVEIKNVTNGTAELSTSAVTFTSTGAAGTDASFTYVAQIKDINLFSVEGTVTITVDEAPAVIANADSNTVQQGGEIYFSATSLMSNDEGNSLTFMSVFNPVNGTLSVDGENITFTSTGLAYEVAQFQYKIKDDLNTEATGTVFITVDPLPEIEAFVYGDIDTFNEQQTVYAPPTMNTVFNSWARFDGNNYFADKDVTGITVNANSWEFLTEPNRVSMPKNVTPYNGFLSPQELENYTFEATVTSPHSDNDNIGLVIAFVRLDTDNDGVEDTNYSLTAVRTRGGMEPKDGWGVMYNVSTGPTHTNGGLGGKIVSEKIIGSTTTANWNGVETRIKVVRTGDTIKCYATDWNNTSTYEASSEIIIDLDSDPDLHKFKGAKRYGYMSFSQPNSTFIDINFDGGIDTSTMMYIDWDTGIVQVWTYNVDHWEISSSTIQEVLGYVRIVTNPVTGNKYLIKENSVELIE
jgi:hypothetical protein